MDLIKLNGLTINLHLTNLCDMKCIGCYAGFVGRKSLCLDQWLKVIENVRNDLHFIPNLKFNFVGGEPFLYPELFQLIKHAKELNCTTSIVTNGFKLFHGFDQINLSHIDWIGISIDSLIPQTNKTLGRLTVSAS
ncbi:MAG: radical SAM protein [Spirochaetaceae bacterium]|jgi:radical S-adenosyl methionine domain-containing protein 2|nr:radical SAM protein [Spirochaetaceae bacterium]